MLEYCKADGCKEQSSVRGYCKYHYRTMLEKGVIDRLPTKTVLERFMENVEMIPEAGCWIWIGCINRKGYGKFSIKCKQLQSHRVSWSLFKGKIPDGLFVCHHCDTPACVNPHHLFLGTNADNMRDYVNKKRRLGFKRFNGFIGSSNPYSKLTESDVIKIRSLFFTYSKIAEMFNVSDTAIYDIKKRRTWKHI